MIKLSLYRRDRTDEALAHSICVYGCALRQINQTASEAGHGSKD